MLFRSGTKEREFCTCGGYRSQCNFYKKEFMKELEDDEKVSNSCQDGLAAGGN